MKIIRGESLVDAHLSLDPDERVERIKMIKNCVTRNCYPSKMLNNGDPYRIVKTGILKHLLQHISEIYEEPKFSQTSHLLSFSSKQEIARRFGTAEWKLSVDAVDSGFSVGGSNAEDVLKITQYLLIEIDITERTPVAQYDGVYLLNYLDNKKLFLINSLEYLIANEIKAKRLPGFEEAKTYAAEESEWLVLSADVLNQSGQLSLSALLHGCNETIDIRAWVNPEDLPKI